MTLSASRPIGGRSTPVAGLPGRDFRALDRSPQRTRTAMHRVLGAGLALRLLRVAGRRGRGCPARLLPGPAGGRAPVADVPPCRGAPRGLGPGLLPLLAGEGRGPAGWAGRAGRAGRGDLSVPSRSARLVLEARPGGAGAGAAGLGRGGGRGRRGRDHPAAEASQGEGLQ